MIDKAVHILIYLSEKLKIQVFSSNTKEGYEESFIL